MTFTALIDQVIDVHDIALVISVEFVSRVDMASLDLNLLKFFIIIRSTASPNVLLIPI
jgi:hypothetical protein